MLAALLVAAAAFGTAEAAHDGIYTKDGRRYQTVWVTGTRGGECTLVRRGKPIARVIVGTANAVAEVEVGRTRADIVLTCRLAGFSTLSRRLSWRKQPCGPEACASAPQYPAAVPMFLDPG